MFKTILLSLLGAILVVALGVGGYYALTNSESALAAVESSSAPANPPIENAVVPQTGNPAIAQGAANSPYSANLPAQGGGNGNGNRYGNRSNNPSGVQSTPNPQADLTQSVTVQGVVVKYEYGTLTLQTDTGELVAIQLGNQNYLRQINFVPVVGESLSLVAFPGDQGLLTAVSVTRLSDGSVYQLRDSSIGRPLWTGGGWGKRGGRQP
ncbi:MAG: hypothetical protein Kow0088_23560 [Anaerolineales bacterium]